MVTTIESLSDYILLPKSERQSHINLDIPCQCYTRSKAYGVEKARKTLLKYLGLPDEKTGRRIHCCHLCSNNSQSEQVCINPQHLYLGTALENNGDISIKKRRENGLKILNNHAGIFNPDNKEKVREGNSKGGKTGGKIGGKIGGKKVGKAHVENQTGLFNPDNKEKCRQGNKKGVKKTNAQRWICLETGHISNAGALSKYQTARGIDTTLRQRIQ